MDLFNRHLEFNKIIFRDKFYYPQEINNSIEKIKLGGSSTPWDTLVEGNINGIIAGGVRIVNGDPDDGSISNEAANKSKEICPLRRRSQAGF